MQRMLTDLHMYRKVVRLNTLLPGEYICVRRHLHWFSQSGNDLLPLFSCKLHLKILNHCCPFVTKPRNILGCNFNKDSNIIIKENTLENILCRMTAILCQPQCVKIDKSVDKIKGPSLAVVWMIHRFTTINIWGLRTPYCFRLWSIVTSDSYSFLSRNL